MLELDESSRVRVRLWGELDVATADTVRERLEALRLRHRAVLLDLDEVEFMDASGLRVVLTAAHAAGHEGWSFAVTRGSPPVRRLFAVLGLERDLPFDGEAT